MVIDKKTGIGIAILVLACSISFYGGVRYGSSKSLAASRGMQGGFANGFQQDGQGSRFADQNGQKSGRMGGGTMGEIIAKDDKSITVKLRDGGSTIVFLTSSTPVTKSVDGAIKDLAVGEQVVVGGTKNSDGSVTAETIQIRPAQVGGAAVAPVE